MTDLITRTLAHADMEVRGDGRTVYGLAVPFDREATVDDGRGPYREVFRRGSFLKTIAEAGGKVKLLGNHNRQKFPLGKATSLTEDAAGLVGEFHVSNTREGDEALELVRDGVLDSFSVGFAGVKERKTGRSLVERLEVRLREVSLVAFPAYEGAAVAGVRAQIADHLSDEELERLLALAHDLGTPIEAASSTSTVEPSATHDEPEFGHSTRIPTRAQRQALALIQGVPSEPFDRDPVPAG